MAVAGLVFGILGIAVCWWAGPALGGLIVTLSAGSSALQGQAELHSTPIWVSGLIIGVGIPLVAVGLSIGGLSKDKKKGVALVGLVIGILSAILGLIATVVLGTGSGLLADAVAPGDAAGAGGTSQMGGYEDMQKTLDDPGFQKQMEKAMKQAQQVQTPPPRPAAASGTPPQPAPGAPASPSSGSALPAEAPSQ